VDGRDKPGHDERGFRHGEERSDEAIHSVSSGLWIASRSLSSGAPSRDPLARNAGFNWHQHQSGFT
jgi:hypothetical protein